ncbi:MAG: phosphoribosylanthranilate isomerase [Dysgonamonadaceae bacterium]|jgi:phosphoribosylanthranilate isomerase|nr:phosphoribosylanthranilate isomerase [Dysgonamonadaceae bacterium]
MKIKVCGMKYPGNIKELSALQPDYMGFIFYEKSKRYAGDLDPDILLSLPGTIGKTGVFVNEDPDRIIKNTKKFFIKTIQLHGEETPDLCRYLKKTGLEVIKAIPVLNEGDVQQAYLYVHCCDYLLFDTKTPLHGGSGEQYDWKILENYKGETPFFLSGGIGMEDIPRILSFCHPGFYGVDVNSKFEEDGISKNTFLLNDFIGRLRH